MSAQNCTIVPVHIKAVDFVMLPDSMRSFSKEEGAKVLSVVRGQEVFVPARIIH